MGNSGEYKNSEIRFCAFLMCHEVPFLRHELEEDPSGNKDKAYCNYVFQLEPDQANKLWAAFQNRNPDFKVDARKYAEEYENLKSMRHRNRPHQNGNSRRR